MEDSVSTPDPGCPYPAHRKHRTRGAYNKGCRCAAAVEAATSYNRSLRREKREGVERPPPTPPKCERPAHLTHGTRAAYVHGCRCPDAIKANTDYQRWRAQERQAGRGGKQKGSLSISERQVAALERIADALEGRMTSESRS